MAIWELEADANNYDNLTLVNTNEWSKFRDYKFDGRPLRDQWEPFAVKIIEKRRDSDLPSFSPGKPVFSKRALQVLEKMILPHSEILSLRSRYGDYYIANITNVLHCIDYEKSEFIRFKSSGRIMRFTKYVFKPEVIEGQNFFKISDQPSSRVFVSDKFKTEVEQSDLQGFLFHKIWG